jgi:hypothetical protein
MAELTVFMANADKIEVDVDGVKYLPVATTSELVRWWSPAVRKRRDGTPLVRLAAAGVLVISAGRRVFKLRFDNGRCFLRKRQAG